VLLNLFNNAFWAVSSLSSEASAKEGTVTLTTKKLSDKIEIRIRDNGPGIPAPLIDKIFQPFFTTKPTGYGTGLGLSLAYDIVKAHGGNMTVKSVEGIDTEFTVVLPVVLGVLASN